jgi:hypothetical protein
MNKKNLFLGLAILLYANQASASLWDDLADWFSKAATWIVSMLPESWQGRACMTSGTCTTSGVRYVLKSGKGAELSQKGVTIKDKSD